MKKVGRNDPCPCGSGKKYKKCHGASNVVKINPDKYNEQLEQLQRGLLDFAFIEYESELREFFERYMRPELLEDEELFDLYSSILVSWCIFQQPFENRSTIFDIYYQSQQAKIKNSRVRKVFASWQEASLTCNEIVSVEQDTLIVEDIRTNKTCQIKVDQEDGFEAGNLLVGTIIPYIHEYRIFLSVFELSDDYGKLFDEISQLTDHEMRDYYPEILAEALVEEARVIEIEFGHYTYQQVADLFEQHMKDKEASDELIMSGKAIWKIFTDRADPIVRKLAAYASALEYVVQNKILNTRLQTQKELADEYQVSTTTVSKNARQIVEAVETELLDFKMINDQAVDRYQPSMEQTLRADQNLLAQKEFESEAEMKQFFNQMNKNKEFTSPSSSIPRDRAQDKLFEAQQKKGAQRKKLIKEALAIYPNSPDAYLLMAEDSQSFDQKYQLTQQAVDVGEIDLGKDFFKENKGDFWGLIETRPFMRAKAQLGIFSAHYGDVDQAITEFEELILLNPNDNQGIRYLLFPLYIETERYKDAKDLIEQYDEGTGSSLFNQALVSYFLEGLTGKTIKLLQQANRENPHVKDYLIGKKETPMEQFATIGIGDESEAITYVQEHQYLWEDAEPLLNQLKKL